MNIKQRLDTLPISIADKERLARAIFYPNHINKRGHIKPSAFKAKSGNRDVSVNRLCVMDANACKKKAQAIGISGSFKGFAVIGAGDVRRCGSDVIDSRHLYFGHADILHDQALPKNEPPPPEFNARLKRMVDLSQYFEDSEPEKENWTGADFVAKSNAFCRRVSNN